MFSLNQHFWHYIWRLKVRLRRDRKQFVCQIIAEEKPLSILEIGCRSGVLAQRMLRRAKELGFVPAYTGIDLFAELASEQNLIQEISQWPKAYRAVEQQLMKEFPGCEIKLLQGYSNEVLPLLAGSTFDLIVIDGGHSYETVRTDWEYSKTLLSRHGSIVFDDYTDEIGWKKGNIGVRRVVDELIDFSLYKIIGYSTVDVFAHSWGKLKTRMVQIKYLDT